MAESTIDPPLSAAQRSRIRRLSQAKDPEVGEEAGEINVVPYLDIIMNILIFVLATVSVTFVASIDTTPPSIGGGKGVRVESKALNLSVFVTNQGVSLKTSGGNVATGCQAPGPGVTVPKKGDQYDWEGLTACAARLKAANPDFKDETQVTITANPDIAYQTIVDTMDSLRKGNEEELFSDVHFGVAR